MFRFSKQCRGSKQKLSFNFLHKTQPNIVKTISAPTESTSLIFRTGSFGQIYCLNGLKIKDDSADYTRLYVRAVVLLGTRQIPLQKTPGAATVGVGGEKTVKTVRAASSAERTKYEESAN